MLITEAKEIQMIRNDYRLPAQRQAEIKHHQLPLKPCALPWGEGMKELAETATFHLATCHTIAKG